MTQLDAALAADLLRESLHQGMIPEVTVTSNSMTPLLRRGDLVLLEHVEPAELRPGDVVTYLGQSHMQTHRFWRLEPVQGEWRLVTRGDRSLINDPPASPSSLVGRVIARRRKGRLLHFRTAPGLWLNHHLARIAGFEARWIARPGLPVGARKRSIWARVLRRLLLLWRFLTVGIMDLFLSVTDGKRVN